MTDILVIRLDKIGDSLLSFPVIDNIKLNFPDSNITVVANNYTKEIFAFNKNIDAIIVYEKYLKDKVKYELLKKKFNYSFTLTEKIDGYLINSYINCPIRVGFSSGIDQPIKTLFYSRWLTDKVYSPHKIKPIFYKHEVERLLDLLRAVDLDVKNYEINLDIDFDESKTRHILKSFNIKDYYISLIFSAKWLLERTSLDFFANIVNKIVEIIPYPLLILYYYKDYPYIQKLEDKLNTKALYLVNDILSMAQFIQFSRVVIGMDSGPIHLAAALKKNIVDVFLNKHFDVNSKRWAPWKTKSIVLKKVNSIDFINQVLKSIFDLLK